MPRETCQSENALKAKPSPCITCARRPTCLVHIAQRNLFEAPKPTVNIVHVVSSCDGYVPIGETIAPGRSCRGKLSIVQSLTAQGVKNLCTGCPDASECGEHHRLAELKDAARANGLKVNFTVVCCSTRPLPLVHIADPA